MPPPNVIAVELFDNSVFKFPLSANTTPRMLLVNVAKKAGLNDYGLFGLVCGTSSDVEEAFYLADDESISAQLPLSMSAPRVTLSLKYCFRDITSDLADPVALKLAFLEYSKRFKNVQELACDNDTLLQLIIQRVHCAAQKSSPPNLDVLRTMLPVRAIQLLADPTFMEGFSYGLQELKRQALSFESSLLKSKAPRLFWATFDAVNIDPILPMDFLVCPDGLRMQTRDKNAVPFFIPYASLSGWEMVCADDPSHYQVCAKWRSENRTMRASKSNSSLTGGGDDVLASKGGKGVFNVLPKKFRNLLRLSKGNGLAASVGDGLNGNAIGTTDRSVVYQFRCEFVETNMGDFDMTILSYRNNDFRIMELVEHYARREMMTYESSNSGSSDELVQMDDPELYAEKIVCVAIADNAAETDDELMFLAGEEVTILQKLDDGIYFGECQDIQGYFRGELVEFPRRKQTALERQRKIRSHQIKSGEPLTVHLLDNTRRTFLSAAYATPLTLMQRMCEKMEFSSAEFFDLVAVEETGHHRWLWRNIPLSFQNVTNKTKLMMRLRLSYLEVHELTETALIFLYYLQAKQFVLNGTCSIDENQVVEYASLQLQASFGDYDADNMKTLVSSFELYLPPQYLKFSLSRNEAWWLKRLSTAYQQHRGLTKTEAEKAYIAMVQTMQLYPFQLFSPMNPDQPMLGVSRDYIALVDRATMTIVEKYEVEYKNLTWRKQSLVVDFCVKSQDGIDKTIKFCSLDTFEIVNVLGQLVQAEITAGMRKTCRGLREKFNVFGVDLDMADLAKNLSDPKLFVLSLANGVALKSLVDTINKPAPDIAALEAEAVKSPRDSTAVDAAPDMASDLPRACDIIPVAETAEMIKSFLAYCTSVLSIGADSLFCEADLENLDSCNFALVLKTISAFFEAEPVKERTTLLQAYNKARKQKFGNKGTNGSSIPSMNMADFRRKIIEEIIATERNYSMDLDKMTEQFIRPLKELAAAAPQVDSQAEDAERSPHDVLRLFSNIEEMSVFHQSFFAELNKTEGNPEAVGEGDALIQLYERYCSDHTDNAERVNEIRSTPAVMAVFGMNGDAQNDQMARHNLASQLIKPVQRIMRYHLLFKELLKYTPAEHAGYANLDKGTAKAKEVASAVNEIKRKKENEATLALLQARIENYEGAPLATLGPLIHDGRLLMVDKQQFVKLRSSVATSKESFLSYFLFEECVIYCKEIKQRGKTTGYKFKGSVPVMGLTVRDQVTDVPPGEDLKISFELYRPDVQKTFVVSASTYEDRDRWITVLTDATRKLATKTADSYNKPLPMLNHATSGPSVHPAATETATSTVDTQLNQVIQEQLREITAQFQALHAEMLRVAGENSVLAEELRQERNQRQRLEVELAVQRGKVQGFEAMLAVPAESRYVLCSGVNDGTAPLEASERKEILLSLDAERKAQEELASLSKDLLSMLDKQLLHQEQPRRNSGVLP